ncbi:MULTISPECIES: HU family DNA-binding protein [unclassified Persephonella]|uniref:HU family DNA-binding protein n=1 Tax=unclassified Persephonella TaxID=2641955 RepID=UPI0004969AE6|nr:MULTISPECIES: HU family DNA-binding protein [unclassified Persephonella]
MTKAELVAKVAAQAGTTKAAAERCVNAFVAALTEALEKGERVALPGLGVFNVKERKARKGRNPRTGEVIKIPARKVVTFHPAKSLKERVK